MAANLQEVQEWIRQAKADGKKYIVSVCDTFDYDDYPVYCDTKEEAAEKSAEYGAKSMQRVNEIIDVEQEFAKL